MEKIAPDVYASTKYPGVNVGFVVVPAGAIAVDVPTLPQHAHAWRQRIVETAGGPILYVILTDVHPDRLLSAGLLGTPIVAARPAYNRASAYTDGFWRGVSENWVRRYPEAADDLARVSIRLPEVLFTNRLTLHKGGVDVTVEHIAGGTPESAWVYFGDLDVLFAGDTLVVETHPYLASALDTGAWLSTLKSLRRGRLSKATIVPGRGPICDQSATLPLSEYIAFMRRRVRSLLRGGRARADRAAVVAELLLHFSVSDEDRDQIQRRIKAGLDQLCEGLGED